jgi:hypothetical protein
MQPVLRMLDFCREEVSRHELPGKADHVACKGLSGFWTEASLTAVVDQPTCSRHCLVAPPPLDTEKTLMTIHHPDFWPQPLTPPPGMSRVVVRVRLEAHLAALMVQATQ